MRSNEARAAWSATAALRAVPQGSAGHDRVPVIDPSGAVIGILSGGILLGWAEMRARPTSRFVECLVAACPLAEVYARRGTASLM